MCIIGLCMGMDASGPRYVTQGRINDVANVSIETGLP